MGLAAPDPRTSDRIDCAHATPGTRGVVAAVRGDEVLRARLRTLGIRTGVRLQVIRRAPWGCPVEVAVHNVHIALRRDDAAAIELVPDAV